MPADSDPSMWEYPPHTRAKHDILASYLDGWFPILSRWNGRLLFLDGFAGRGRYKNGAEGSPLVALRRLVDHRHFPRMGNREFVFYLVAANEDNAASLDREVRAFKEKRVPWPNNVKTHVVNGRFDATATAIIEQLREQKANLAPTFAFIDPFGYSGIPMDLLSDLLAYAHTEVLINFMVGNVQRFISRDGQERAMSELFGMDVRSVLEGYDGQRDRVEYLRDVYARQLQHRAGFDHVQSFAMVNNTGNIGYYLLHGTRHRAGVKLMKNAMWRADPGGTYTFSDRLADEDVLFVLEPDLRPLRNELLKHFAGRRGVTTSDIEWHTLLHTPYREVHVRPVLKQLEGEGLIAAYRPPGKRQYAEGVTLNFPA